MAMEKLNTATIICEGGLDSNQNYLLLSQRSPGVATTLLNFEPGLYGGYRRLSGFTALNDTAEVDSAGAEGKILGLAFYDGDVIAMRKQQAGATYKFYRWDDGNPWSAYTTSLTHTSTGVNKVRFSTFNFDGTEKIIFTDGINKGLIFDGTTWQFISSSSTGADYANAGGAQAIDAPKFITVFKNHIFMAGDSTNPNVIAHSAPNEEFDWTSASGAGQIVAGFAIKQLFVFREELYVFGERTIKKVVVSGTDFVLKDVTSNIGCIASDSVVEFNGDLLFLAQDGIRTIAATERVGDIEIAIQSKRIQQDVVDLIGVNDLTQINAVVVKKKSQVRFFFSDSSLNADRNTGILCGLRSGEDTSTGVALEWARTLGIRTSCAASDYIGTEEYVLHGDYNGTVYRQEVGNNFGGDPITAVYTMPYLDFGDTNIRKTLHKITAFIRPEGDTNVSARIQYDWENGDVFNPDTYSLTVAGGDGGVYDVSLYDNATYADNTTPLTLKNVEGSGMSSRISFFTQGSGPSYSIQAVVFEYSINGRK